MNSKEAREKILSGTEAIYEREQERKEHIQKMIERTWRYRLIKWFVSIVDIK